MTFQDQAVLTQLLFFVFCAGIFTGAICTGFLNSLKSIFFNWVERPKRIRTHDGYLYRYQQQYVSKEFYNDRILERQEKMKKQLEQDPLMPKRSMRMFIFGFAMLVISFAVFIFSRPFPF